MNTSDKHRRSAEERELEKIFSLATPRTPPPELIERKVREAVHEEWRQATARNARRWPKLASLAAAVLLVVAAGLWLRPGDPARVLFEEARVLRVEGQSQLLGSEDSTVLSPGMALEVFSGDRLRSTTASGLTLDLGARGEIRLGPGTELRIEGPERIRLNRGQLFLATRQDSVARLDVDTALGLVRHVGTRFQVILAEGELRVDVREGAVVIESQQAAPTRAAAGTSARLDSVGNLKVQKLKPFGPSWDWADQLAPPFSIDGRSLHATAAWAAEQSGRVLEFEDSGVEREARATTLHGDLVLKEPLSGLRQVMMTTRLQFVLQGERILISARR